MLRERISQADMPPLICQKGEVRCGVPAEVVEYVTLTGESVRFICPGGAVITVFRRENRRDLLGPQFSIIRRCEVGCQTFLPKE